MPPTFYCFYKWFGINQILYTFFTNDDASQVYILFCHINIKVVQILFVEKSEEGLDLLQRQSVSTTFNKNQANRWTCTFTDRLFTSSLARADLTKWQSHLFDVQCDTQTNWGPNRTNDCCRIHSTRKKNWLPNIVFFKYISMYVLLQSVHLVDVFTNGFIECYVIGFMIVVYVTSF